MYPVASGITSLSGSLIPEIYSLKTQVKFYLSTVFTEISNMDYQDEIKKQGDTVNIRILPDVTVRSHTIGADLIRQRMTGSYIQMVVDQGDYWSLVLDTVEMKQADIPYMEKMTDDGGRRLKEETDRVILANVYADAATTNAGNTAGAISSAYRLGASGAPEAADKTTIIDIITDANSALTENNCPEEGRFFIGSTLILNLLKKSDIKDASMMGDTVSPTRNGRIGKIDNSTIYRSNQVALSSDSSGVTAHNCIAGTKDAITFASQLTDSRNLPHPTQFGTIIEGLHVWGYKVVKPEALAHVYIYKA